MRNKSFIIRYDLICLLTFRHIIKDEIEDNNVSEDVIKNILKDVNNKIIIKIHDIDFIINDTFNIINIVIINNLKENIINNLIDDLIDDVNDVKNKFFEIILTQNNNFFNIFINNIKVENVLYVSCSRFCKNFDLIEEIDDEIFKIALF